MDEDTRERFHKVELKHQEQDSRMDGIERLLKEQAKAFNDFRNMVNSWAKRFAYIIISIAALNVSGQDGGSMLISIIAKVIGL